MKQFIWGIKTHLLLDSWAGRGKGFANKCFVQDCPCCPQGPLGPQGPPNLGQQQITIHPITKGVSQALWKAAARKHEFPWTSFKEFQFASLCVWHIFLAYLEPISACSMFTRALMARANLTAIPPPGVSNMKKYALYRLVLWNKAMHTYGDNTL